MVQKMKYPALGDKRLVGRRRHSVKRRLIATVVGNIRIMPVKVLSAKIHFRVRRRSAFGDRSDPLPEISQTVAWVNVTQRSSGFDSHGHLHILLLVLISLLCEPNFNGTLKFGNCNRTFI